MDHVLIATAYDNEARIYVATTKNLVEKARLIHSTEPTATAALGRLLTVGGLMIPMYKDNSLVTLKIDGDGPIGSMLVDINNNGLLRAYIKNPHVYIKDNKTGKLAVGLAVGNGTLTVLRDPQIKNSFSSSVNLQTGEIGDDFTYYFTISEQTPSSVGVGILVGEKVLYAGGFIIQLLPNASEKTIIQIEEILSKLTGVTNMFKDGLTTLDILNLLSNGTEKLLSTTTLKYHCDCTKKYYETALMKLDNNFLDKLINEDDGAEIICRYCNTKYNFTAKDLKCIKDSKKVM